MPNEPKPITGELSTEGVTVGAPMPLRVGQAIPFDPSNSFYPQILLGSEALLDRSPPKPRLVPAVRRAMFPILLLAGAALGYMYFQAQRADEAAPPAESITAPRVAGPITPVPAVPASPPPSDSSAAPASAASLPVKGSGSVPPPVVSPDPARRVMSAAGRVNSQAARQDAPFAAAGASGSGVTHTRSTGDAAPPALPVAEPARPTPAPAPAATDASKSVPQRPAGADARPSSCSEALSALGLCSATTK